MLQFVTSLFGCAHRHCTFPITAKNSSRAALPGKPSASTYIVCLDCGKEFPYDWQKMKVVARPVLVTEATRVHVA
jgi:predicted transcriptional regulator